MKCVTIVDSTICIHLVGSGRLEKLAKPLSTVGIECLYGEDNVKPRTDIDAVLTDVPGTTLLRAAVLAARKNCPLIYRMRGDYWQELRAEGRLAGFRVFLADNLLFPLCDAICTPDAHLQATVERRTKFSGPVSVVEVPKDAGAFPTVEHTDENNNLITLTNFDYREKIKPLYDYLQSAERVLANTGGNWYVGGNGRFASEFRSNTTQYDNISYVGFVDPHEYLKQSAVMIHFSRFDIALPNAVLEGMAAGLPVLVNNHKPFVENERAILINSTAEFENQLQSLLREPSRRSEIGDRNQTYVQRNHSMKTIGTKLRRVIKEVLPED